MHIHGVFTLNSAAADLALAAGMWASLPMDFFVKVSGSGELNQSVIRRFPHPRPLGEVTQNWTMATPLRKDAERRQALVEIDALAAVMLGITAEELCAIYRTQFGVLRKYERVMQHDKNGRQVPKDILKDHDRHGPAPSSAATNSPSPPSTASPK